jgi:hypothetical protein
LLLQFNDGFSREIDFLPALKVLEGDWFGALLRPEYFRQVKLNEESGIIEWPNEVDFSAQSLHDWPHFLEWLQTKYPQEYEAAKERIAAREAAKEGMAAAAVA